MNARIETAAQALATKDRANLSSWHQEEATEAIVAADAVMFSDEAIERAARVVSWVKLPFGGRSDSFVQLDANAAHAAVRIVVAALKGEA